MQDSISYEDAGVSIEKGQEAVDEIKLIAKQQNSSAMLNSIGGFASLFDLKAKAPHIQNPILVSGTDGVGTKLEIAILANQHLSIGQDLVDMCVNDILCHGATPLFFLDYFATSKLDPLQLKDVVQGIQNACMSIDCALAGGETAEMPGFYPKEHYDLAGFCVGVVDKERLVNGNTIKPGDSVIGLSSSGLHSNGFSLVRKIILGKLNLTVQNKLPYKNVTVAEELLVPTTIYTKPVLNLLADNFPIKGMAHITGGGLIENAPRQLPKGLGLILDTASWSKPEIFSFLEKSGPVSLENMFNTFNMGIGFIIIVAKNEEAKMLSGLSKTNLKAQVIGSVVENEKPVQLVTKHGTL